MFSEMKSLVSVSLENALFSPKVGQPFFEKM